MQKLVDGLHRFKAEIFNSNQELFAPLVDGLNLDRLDPITEARAQALAVRFHWTPGRLVARVVVDNDDFVIPSFHLHQTANAFSRHFTAIPIQNHDGYHVGFVPTELFVRKQKGLATSPDWRKDVLGSTYA